MTVYRNVGATLLFLGSALGIYFTKDLFSGNVVTNSDIFNQMIYILFCFAFVVVGHISLMQFANSQKDLERLCQNLAGYGFRQKEIVSVTVSTQQGYFEGYTFDYHSQKITISESCRDNVLERNNPLRFRVYFDHQKHLVLVNDRFQNCAYLFSKGKSF